MRWIFKENENQQLPNRLVEVLAVFGDADSKICFFWLILGLCCVMLAVKW